MPLRLLRPETLRKLLLGWIVLFTALVVFALSENRARSNETRQLIEDIQQSRLGACRRTYEGVREVFLPFFPPEKTRTRKQERDWIKFNATVDRLKTRCDRQTTTEGDTR